MSRIQEIKIIECAHRSPYIVFRDAVDVQHDLNGRTYRPSYVALKMIQRLAKDMTVDISFAEGVTRITRKDFAELSKAEADRDAYKAALEPYADWNNWQRLDKSTGAIIFIQEDGKKDGFEIAAEALK